MDDVRTKVIRVIREMEAAAIAAEYSAETAAARYDVEQSASYRGKADGMRAACDALRIALGIENGESLP